MRITLIRNAAKIDRVSIGVDGRAEAGLEMPPQHIQIGDEIFARIDDPDNGEFLGAYALIGGEPATVEEWMAPEPPPKPEKVWLNAMLCVRPTDEFAAQVGRMVIDKVMREGTPKVEPLDPFRRLVVEVVCS